MTCRVCAHELTLLTPEGQIAMGLRPGEGAFCTNRSCDEWVRLQRLRVSR